MMGRPFSAETYFLQSVSQLAVLPISVGSQHLHTALGGEIPSNRPYHSVGATTILGDQMELRHRAHDAKRNFELFNNYVNARSRFARASQFFLNW